MFSFFQENGPLLGHLNIQYVIDFASNEDRDSAEFIYFNTIEFLNSINCNVDREPHNESILSCLFDQTLNLVSQNFGKTSGNIQTPTEINSLIAELQFRDENNESLEIYDPTCGNGGSLVSISLKAKNAKVYGQEISYNGTYLTVLNLLIHGVRNYEITDGSVLNNPRFLDENNNVKKFDIIVSHPPFGLKMWNENPNFDFFNRWNDKTGIPSNNNGDGAFILHNIKSLRIGGIAYCIIPNGFFYKEGVDKKIREYLVDKGFIKGIIALPPRLLYATSIPCSILILENNPSKPSNDIFLIDASGEFSKERFLNRLNAGNITKIADTWHRNDEISGFSKKVSIEEIVESDYNLQITRYTDFVGLKEIPEGFKAIKLSNILSTLPRVRETNGLGKIIKISNLSSDPFLYELDYSILPNAEINRNFVKITLPCLLLSKRFNKLKPSFIKASEEYPVFISPEIEAFKLDNESVDISFLVFQLYNDYTLKQLENSSTGDIMPMIRTNDLLAIQVLVPILEIQDSLIKQKALVDGARIQEDKSKIEKLQLQSTIDRLLTERLNDFQWKLHDIRNGELLRLKGQITTLDVFSDLNPDLFNKPFVEDSGETLKTLIGGIYKSYQNVANFLSDLYDSSSQSIVKEEIDVLKFLEDFCERQTSLAGNLYQIIYDDIDVLRKDYEKRKLTIICNKKDLESILFNIFENAIKHGEFANSNKTNRIRISLTIDNSIQTITIGILNNGRKSSISELDYFADGGKAGPNANSGKGGHIVKTLVERNNGKASQINYFDNKVEDYTFEISLQFNLEKSHGL
ncbi:N-6 DNA methylase [Lacihabitans sp. CCS-44]|uniref:N-6 DNA methylase n=1 Tax=Lacihabitans sp. CCS-44 TaxID=2487331 RepID=UPI0020CE0C25|nr:N-6 DNA methylase [Lacihabitans sp. CCS-44]